MASIRIVKTHFRADTYNQGPTEGRDFTPGTWLVLLRHDPENGSTFFARVADIPEIQPVPPRHLPEYLADSDLFENSTRVPT